MTQLNGTPPPDLREAVATLTAYVNELLGIRSRLELEVHGLRRRLAVLEAQLAAKEFAAPPEKQQAATP
jgi:regulator of replication initiation timing